MLKLGFRCVGKTQGWGGQYATIKYLHVCWMPLIPVAAVWIVNEDGADRRGHPMRFSLRSVVAGYATMWALFLAVFGLGIAPAYWMLGLPIAIASATVLGWVWRARALRGERARRRSDLNLLAVGTRCDPVAMPLLMAKDLRRRAETAWAEVSDGRSPDDVAARGARDEVQAIRAYGLLRLAARTADRTAAARAFRASEQILDRHREPDEVGSPYRRSDASSDIHRGRPS